MVKWKPPPPSILIPAQAMPYPDMPTQNLPLPAAFEANDIVARNRSPDLHRWIARLRFRRFPQRQQGLIDNVDERRHVGGGSWLFLT
jgi:hypothetical protein